jgi:hypothetical protein
MTHPPGFDVQLEKQRIGHPPLQSKPRMRLYKRSLFRLDSTPRVPHVLGCKRAGFLLVREQGSFIHLRIPIGDFPVRAIACSFVFLVFTSVARAQVSSLPQAQQTPETMAKACRYMLSFSKNKYFLDNVRSFLDLVKMGGMDSHAELAVQNMGDGVSIAVLKIVDPNDLLKPEFVKAYLKMVRTAFSRPQSTFCVEDKSPEVTMFLLDYLREKVQDKELQREIDSTREYVLKQAEPPKQSPFPEPSQRAK